MDRSYNNHLIAKYASKVVCVSYERPSEFSVAGTRFRFQLRKCPVTGNDLLKAQIVFPDGSTEGAEKLSLLINGLTPVKDVPFNPKGRLETCIKWFRLKTRLADRDIHKRRRKYLQEQRIWAELLDEIKYI